MFFQLCLLLKGSRKWGVRMQTSADCFMNWTGVRLNATSFSCTKQWTSAASNQGSWIIFASPRSIPEKEHVMAPVHFFSLVLISIKNGFLYQRHLFLQMCFVAAEWTLSICLFLLKQLRSKEKWYKAQTLWPTEQNQSEIMNSVMEMWLRRQ